MVAGCFSRRNERLRFLVAAFFTFVACYFPSPVFPAPVSTAKAAEFTFENDRVVLLISPLSRHGSRFLAARLEGTSGGWLTFATPQFSAESKTEVRVALERNFRRFETLKSDMKSAGFEAEPHRKKLAGGDLYEWSTPTKGASNYYYFESHTSPHTALRIGPIAATVSNELDFNWDKIRWVKLNK